MWFCCICNLLFRVYLDIGSIWSEMVEFGNVLVVMKVVIVFIIIVFVVFLVGFGVFYWRDYFLGGNSGFW